MMRKKITPFIFVICLLTLQAKGSPLNDDRAQRTKEFVVMGYQGIQMELKMGEGPYLQTLSELMGCQSEQKLKLIDQVKSLSKQFPNIMDFADQIVALKKNETNSDHINQVPVLVVPTGPTIYSGENIENALNHLTKGMDVLVFLKNGEKIKGKFVEYSVHRLWVRANSQRSIALKDILAVDAPGL